MKKVILIIPAVFLSMLLSAQHLETTIKIVGGKARIAVKAVGGDISGPPSGTTFCVAIPIANSGASLNTPTILDATRLPTLASLQTGTYSDATYKYFIMLWVGASSPVTFVNNTEHEIVELRWASGPNEVVPVSLISMANGNPSASVLPSQWVNYLEVGGAQYSFGDNLYYQSATSTVPVQMAADYSSGTAQVTTSTTINTTLPVSLVNFSGYKSGSKNVLKWTTSSEQNNTGFEIQRSTDGVNYSVIGFVSTLASGGNSSTELSYTFDDNSPVVSKRNYYRLNQKDIDGRSKMSNVVLISGDKPTTIGIGGIFPNPASTTVNVLIDAPRRDDVTVVLMDVLGKTIKQKVVNVEIGSNTVPVEIGSLASGSYLVKVLCKSSDCETAVSKFAKQ